VVVQAAPCVKWAGGKRKLLPVLEPLLPQSWGRYYEPCLGGGALFFHLWSAGRLTGGSSLNDLNQRLMNLYRGLQADVEAVVRELEHLALDTSEAGYLRAVKEFNAHRPEPAGSHLLFPMREQLPLARQAALLLFIIRLCFNGLFRERRNGGYNVGYCHNPAQFTLRADELRATAQALAGAQLTCRDFADAALEAQRGDLVFIDSPYDGTFTGYLGGGFGPKDQDRLARTCEILHDRGVLFLLTNSDTKATRARFSEFEIISSKEARSINNDGTGRDAEECVIVRNYRSGA